MLTFDEVGNNDYRLTRVQPVEDDTFFGDLSTAVAAAPKREALLFVHGYNVPLDRALETAALIAYQIGFQGVPIAYAWAGQERWWRYGAALDEVPAASDKLATVVGEVVNRSGATRIHVVAHSLGNSVLVEALEKHRREGGKPLGAELVMAAPDVSTNRFGELAGVLSSLVSRITLYASAQDVPLRIAGKIKAYPRIGFAQPPLPVYRGTDSVDSTGVDLSPLGHSYYGDADILRDVEKVIGESALPGVRGLAETGPAGRRYWVFTR